MLLNKTNQSDDFQVFLVCSFCIHQLPHDIVGSIHCELLRHNNESRYDKSPTG